MVVGYDDDVSSIDDVTSDSSDDGVYDVTKNKIVTSQSEVVKDVEVENSVEDVIENEKVIMDFRYIFTEFDKLLFKKLKLNYLPKFINLKLNKLI